MQPPTLLIPIVGMLIPIIIVPTALWFKHARTLRELEHAERMRALELGRPLNEERTWTPAGVATKIGFGVPTSALFVAFIASSEKGASETIWIAAGLIGVTGVVCGSILAALAFFQSARTEMTPAEKPAYDPEAFDVVGRRG